MKYKRLVAINFPASRGLSGREINESRRERPLRASDGLFDEAANQISGWNFQNRFPSHKTAHALFYSLLKTSESTVSQAKQTFDQDIIKIGYFFPWWSQYQRNDTNTEGRHYCVLGKTKYIYVPSDKLRKIPEFPTGRTRSTPSLHFYSPKPLVVSPLNSLIKNQVFSCERSGN